MSSFTVISPGMLTTIQDGGRFSHQHSGMCVSGVMDAYAHRTANILCGNSDQNEAVIEVSMIGPTLKFNSDAFISITGANISPMIDERIVKMWSSFPIYEGNHLSFGKIKSGVRSYIGIYGGIDVPKVLSSKSTYTMAGIGGYNGRALQTGDEINLNTNTITNARFRELPLKYVPQYKNEKEINVVLGPQDNAFTSNGLYNFLSQQYTVTPKFNRMGYRLDGPKIEHSEKADIISDGIVMGAIQVTGEGLPIILMSDRQTAGGYTKIACVIQRDLSEIAQANINNKLKFYAISVEQAQVEYIKWENKFKEITDELYN